MLESWLWLIGAKLLPRALGVGLEPGGALLAAPLVPLSARSSLVPLQPAGRGQGAMGKSVIWMSDLGRDLPGSL